MAEEFETRLHQLNEAFVASTTASINIDEALTVVKHRAATDLQHDGGPDMDLSLEPVLHLIPRTTGTSTATISYALALAAESVAACSYGPGTGLRRLGTRSCAGTESSCPQRCGPFDCRRPTRSTRYR
jgi:hypothetical protein